MGIISAEEINAYASLAADHGKIERDKRQRRDSLVLRLEAGHAQESGKFKLELSARELPDWEARFYGLLNGFKPEKRKILLRKHRATKKQAVLTVKPL
jgi:hypothetical protein